MTLDDLNSAPLAQAQAMLAGLYEHSDWIAEQALTERPFQSLAHLQYAMCRVLDAAGRDAQLALLRAHLMKAGDPEGIALPRAAAPSVWPAA